MFPQQDPDLIQGDGPQEPEPARHVLRAIKLELDKLTEGGRGDGVHVEEVSITGRTSTICAQHVGLYRMRVWG